MKKGFTMIELIFVIVILGILAAVAIPRLAATRDDAVAAGLKSDIATALSAIPAWFQGQRDMRMRQSVPFDTNVWTVTDDVNITFDDEGAVCIALTIQDVNASGSQGLAVADTDFNSTTGRWLGNGADGDPVLVYTVSQSNDGVICTALRDMGAVDQNVSMAGNRVQW